MSDERTQPSKGKLKYYSPKANSTCAGCRDISQKLEIYKDTIENQQNTIIKILTEHKLLLDRMLSQNVAVENIVAIFPISSEEKLKELDTILATHADPYKRQMQLLIAGNVERNLHLIFSENIIKNFNVDGISGKRRLRDLTNVFSVIIDVISKCSECPDKTLRAAFQRQKKKFFKQTTRNKNKLNNQNINIKPKHHEAKESCENEAIEFIEIDAIDDLAYD